MQPAVTFPNRVASTYKSDPLWIADDEDRFRVHGATFTDSDGSVHLDDHPVYKAGDVVVVHYLAVDGYPHTIRGPVLGWARNLLIVASRGTFAIAVDPKDTLGGKPVIGMHSPPRSLRFDGSFASIRSQALRWQAEAPILPHIAREKFGRAVTWCAVPLSLGGFYVAPMSWCAFNLPSTRTYGMVTYAQQTVHAEKGDFAQARKMLETQYSYTDDAEAVALVEWWVASLRLTPRSAIRVLKVEP